MNGINTIYFYRLETVDAYPVHINSNMIKYIKNNDVNTNWSDVFMESNTTTIPDYTSPLTPEELARDILVSYDQTIKSLR
jgi:hypothetical protein